MWCELGLVYFNQSVSPVCSHLFKNLERTCLFQEAFLVSATSCCFFSYISSELSVFSATLVCIILWNLMLLLDWKLHKMKETLLLVFTLYKNRITDSHPRVSGTLFSLNSGCLWTWIRKKKYISIFTNLLMKSIFSFNFECRPHTSVVLAEPGILNYRYFVLHFRCSWIILYTYHYFDIIVIILDWPLDFAI